MIYLSLYYTATNVNFELTLPHQQFSASWNSSEEPLVHLRVKEIYVLHIPLALPLEIMLEIVHSLVRAWSKIVRVHYVFSRSASKPSNTDRKSDQRIALVFSLSKTRQNVVCYITSQTPVSCFRSKKVAKNGLIFLQESLVNFFVNLPFSGRVKRT